MRETERKKLTQLSHKEAWLPLMAFVARKSRKMDSVRDKERERERVRECVCERERERECKKWR